MKITGWVAIVAIALSYGCRPAPKEPETPSPTPQEQPVRPEEGPEPSSVPVEPPATPPSGTSSEG
jgi:hypothetical protein